MQGMPHAYKKNIYRMKLEKETLHGRHRLRLVMEAPTSSTIPINSCLITNGYFCGTAPLKIWRSEPQMAVEVTFRITSLGSRISGSGTLSRINNGKSAMV